MQSEQGTAKGREGPPLQRARNPDSPTVHVAVDIPKDVVLWLDAESMAGDKQRGTLINEILAKWKRECQHHHMVVQRVVESNLAPSDSEAAGAAS